MKKYLLYLLLPVLTSSCIKELDIEMPTSEGMITLNGIIKNGEDGFSLHMSESVAFTNTDWPPTITDAYMEFRVNGSAWEYVSLCDTASNQFCVNESINTGDYFEVRANYKDQPEITASAYVPDFAAIKDPVFTDRSINFLLDQPQGEHYYIIDVINFETTYDEDFNLIYVVNQNQITTSNPTFELLGSSNELIDLPIDESYGLMAFAKSSSLPVNWRPVDLQYYSFDQSTFYLRIRKCDKSYYEFQRTKILNRQSNDNPFVQPVNYHSNVKNGLGVLGAYSEKLFKLN